MDDDFGVVKEEIIEDECPLPCFNGRVVSWLVSAEGGSVLGDETGSQCDTDTLSSLPPGAERGPGVGETRPPSFHGGPISGRMDSVDTANSIAREFDDTESSITSVSQVGQRRHVGGRMPLHGRAQQLRGPAGGNRFGDASSVLSSEIETTSFFDTEDNESMASSRFTTSTEATSVSRQHANRVRKQKRLRHRKPAHLSRASSISSVTDSTLSLNIITVTLNMDTVNFLGISIVGQSNQGGDGGIYVGSIMKGGAVALDGRIEPGDMILQVNDINFENMSNDDAVRVLRDVVQKPGPIKLVVAKCWDPHPKDYFTVPRTEPVRPIDPVAWVAHTAAVRGLELPQAPPAIPGYLGAGQHGRAPSLTTLTSSSPSLASTVQAAGQGREDAPLTVQSGMKAICGALQRPGSGLEVRDRLWLKITIPQAFIGSDVVTWLYARVAGFADRREARKYASQMLKAGFIRHTVSKSSFSEQCYYAFGDLATASLQAPGSHNLLKESSGSETDRDTLGPLPAPSHVPGTGAWAQYPAFAPPPQPPQAVAHHDPGHGGPTFPSGGLGPIYNPAPPPSTYLQFGLPHNNQSPSGSSGGASSIRHQLAASGSGSDSEVNLSGGSLGIANLSIRDHPSSVLSHPGHQPPTHSTFLGTEVTPQSAM